MAYNPRYQMTFGDLRGATWNVSLCLENYSDQVLTMQGGPTPLVIRYEGDESNIFDPMRRSKAVIQFYIRSTDQQIFADTDNITDKTFFVLVEAPELSFKWEGWLIPDERQRKLQKDGYYLSLTAIDYFSLTKGNYFQYPDGDIIQNQLSLINVLYYSIFGTLPDGDESWRYKVEHVISYFGADVSDSNVNGHILAQAGTWADNFLDSNARPIKCEEVINKLHTSLGMYCFYSNGFINFRSPIALVSNSIRVHQHADTDTVFYDTLTKEVNTKSFNDSDTFLLNNSDIITNERANREVSVRWTYQDIVSIMRNPMFLDYDTGTNTFDFWPKKTYITGDDGTDFTMALSRAGSGLRGNPYVLRQAGSWNPQQDKSVQGVEGSAIRSIKQGEKLRIEFKFRYADYRSIPGFPSDRSIYLYNEIRIKNDTEEYAFQSRDGDERWLVPSPTAAAVFTIEIRSTKEFQTFSITSPPSPINGELSVRLFPVVFLDIPAPQVYQLSQIVDYRSVNIGIEAIGNTQEITGQAHYLTQAQQYSTIADTQDVYLGDAPNDTIAGALFKADQGLPMPQPTLGWSNQLDSSLYPMLRQLVRMYMFFSRYPQPKIECEIFSNTLLFEHLLLFKNGNDTYLDGKYMQTTDEYDVKACMHKIVAAALNGTYGDSSDDYEYVDETSGGD